MGNNVINSITLPNKVNVDDVNQYYTASTGIVYPRNVSSGAIQGDTHDLGSAATQWKNLYANNIVINGTLFDPDATGAGIDASNAIVSGATRTDSGQPDFLRASGAGASMTILATTTNLAITANATSVTITSDIAVSSLTVAPAANNTALVNDTALAGGAETKYTGEHESDPITIDTVGTEISDRIGQYICLKGTTEYMLAYVQDATTLRHIMRGFFFDSAGAPIVRETKTNNDTLTIMSLGWVFMDSDGVTVDISYTSPIYNATEPTSPVADDYWFDLVNRLWMRYDGAAYQEVDRIPVGLVVIDGTNAVAARSFDFTKAFSDNIEMEVEVESVTKTRSKAGKNTISVYAQTSSYDAAPLDWDITTDLESGLTEANSTLYYLYITEQGAPKIATERPYNRESDLKGYYHPYHSWRYVGNAYNDPSSNLVNAFSTNSKINPYDVVAYSDGATAASIIEFIGILEADSNYDISIPYVDDGTTSANELQFSLSSNFGSTWSGWVACSVNSSGAANDPHSSELTLQNPYAPLRTHYMWRGLYTSTYGDGGGEFNDSLQYNSIRFRLSLDTINRHKIVIYRRSLK